MRITSLHVDTTGDNAAKDSIVQILIASTDNMSEYIECKSYIIKPEGKFSISENTANKSGLTVEIIEEKGQPFADIAQELADIIDKAGALVAYKSEWHLSFLQHAFDACGIDPHFEKHSIIDPYIIEINTNSHALDEVFARAFNPAPDLNRAEKSLMVFCQSQMQKIDKETIKKFRDPNDTQHYPDGWVKMDGEVLKFNKGQYKDQPVIDIIKKDTGYIKWLCKNNLVTMPTRKAFKAVIEEMKQGC